MALIAYKKQYSAHSLLQTSHKLPERKSPALCFAPCSILQKFWSPSPKVLSIQQNSQVLTQKVSSTTVSEHRKHILGQRIQSDPWNSALLTLSSAKRGFPPTCDHPRTTDPPLSTAETATVDFFMQNASAVLSVSISLNPAVPCKQKEKLSEAKVRARTQNWWQRSRAWVSGSWPWMCFPCGASSLPKQ